MPKELIHFTYDHSSSWHICNISKYSEPIARSAASRITPHIITKIIVHYTNASIDDIIQSICSTCGESGFLTLDFVGCIIASKICGNEVKYYGDTLTIVMNKNKKMINNTLIPSYNEIIIRDLPNLLKYIKLFKFHTLWFGYYHSLLV